MAFTLWTLFEVLLLSLNAVCVLHEERFLAKVGWAANQNVQGFGEAPSFKSQMLNLVRSIRTVVRDVDNQGKNLDQVPMDAFLGKKYKLETTENFNEFMKALGVRFWTRQGANLVYPTVELTKTGDEYSLSTTSTFKSQIIKFKPGVQFDEVTLDGRNVKSTITFEGNRMIHQSRGEKNSKIIREYTPEKMTAILSVDNVVSTRVYKLQE